MHKRAVGAVTLLGLVILAIVAILVARQDDDVPTPTPTGTATPTSATLLVQVRDSSLLALGSVLMGINGERDRLDQLWWSPEWWIDQVGSQEVSAADLGRKPVPFVMSAVQNQSQVPVNDAWVMDRLAFAGLVDALGGVRVDFANRTAYINDKGLPEIVPAGTVSLAGAQAADFIFDPSLRNETARLRRFQAVWDQIVRRFPNDPEKARTLVVSLGALSKSTLSTDELAAYLAAAKELRVSGAYGQATVPLNAENFVRVAPPQGVRVAQALDPDRMAARMSRVFAGHEPLDQPVARVYAAAIRSQDVEVMRGQLASRGWFNAWGGRATQMTSSTVVSPQISEAQKLGIEQAVGMVAATGELAWGDARVDVARSSSAATSGGN